MSGKFISISWNFFLNLVGKCFCFGYKPKMFRVIFVIFKLEDGVSMPKDVLKNIKKLFRGFNFFVKLNF